MIAYCWRSGLIGFCKRKAPPGAIKFSVGYTKRWRTRIQVGASEGKSGEYWVPGVYLEDTDEGALRALKDWVAWRDGKLTKKQVEEARHRNFETMQRIMGKEKSEV
jgi:hypothetical protein